jgi:hypothetical protein
VANSKISALTSATTPLVGTETLPIVQGGATVKTTVADITNGGGYAGSFTSLTYTNTLTGGTGIVNLGSNQFYKSAIGNIGLGIVASASANLRISKNITGAGTSYGILLDGVIQSDAITNALAYYSIPSTQAAAFTLSNLINFTAAQSTIGAGSVVTTQYGFYAASTLTGATSNYGFYGQINAPTSGILTTGTITSISSSTTTVTVNHNAITYTNGQIVTISATANATALVSGATCTILTVGSTDFTLIGAASNTVGVSFTATGAGTGSGTVRLNVQGSGKTVAGAASGSFTYTTTTSQTFAAVTVLTGSVTVSLRYNLYMVGTAPNYLAGGLNVGATTDPGAGNISLTGNVVQGTAAKGFDFSANTPAAGKTSTVLNWYEEGTWTPNQGAGLTLVGAFSSTGKYTRVGRNVTVSGTVTGATSVAVTAAGVITTNLPFTIGTAGHGNATNAANTASAAIICNTGTTVTSAGAIAATGTITFSATYFV